jgi:hypothetical protein
MPRCKSGDFFLNSSMRLPGYVGGTQDLTAVKAFVAGNNGTVSTEVNASTGIAPGVPDPTITPFVGKTTLLTILPDPKAARDDLVRTSTKAARITSWTLSSVRVAVGGKPARRSLSTRMRQSGHEFSE